MFAQGWQQEEESKGPQGRCVSEASAGPEAEGAAQAHRAAVQGVEPGCSTGQHMARPSRCWLPGDRRYAVTAAEGVQGGARGSCSSTVPDHMLLYSKPMGGVLTLSRSSDRVYWVWAAAAHAACEFSNASKQLFALIPPHASHAVLGASQNNAVPGTLSLVQQQYTIASSAHCLRHCVRLQVSRRPGRYSSNRSCQQ